MPVIASWVRPFIVFASAFSLFPVCAFGEPDVPTSRPANIQVQRELRAEFEAMRHRSPTFRLQFERLADVPSLLIGMRLDPTLVERSYRAHSTIRRYTSGLLVVSVVVGAGGDRAEWIGHEFEHILEQLDGWNLLMLLRHRP